MKKSIALLMALVMVFTISQLNAAIAQNTSIKAESHTTAVNGDRETLTINIPSGVKSGDLLIAQITYEKGRDAWPITHPGGWNHIVTTDAYQGGGYTDIGQVLYWKTADSNEPASYTWRFSQSVEALGGIIRYSGVAESPIIASSGQGGYGESTGQNQMVANGITAEEGAMIVGFYGIKELANLETPNGMNRVYQQWDRDNDYSILAVEEVGLAAGATGSRIAYSWEYDDPRESLESQWVSQLVTLRPSNGEGTTQQPPVGPPAGDSGITIFLDGQLLQLEDLPTIENGRTLVPMRGFFEALGADVSWDASTKTATGIRGGTVVRIPIGSNQPTVNGSVVVIQVPARIINNRTYIPLRFVGEALGEQVDWDGTTRSVIITTR